MITIDLFAGCGGMTLGFMNVGFKIVAAYDNWQPAIDTYSKNFSHPIFKCDLNNWRNHFSILSQSSPCMIIGGPPCQDFSSAGKRDENNGNAVLTLRFAEIVVALQPKWFVMENVSCAQQSRSFQSAKQIFKQAGYGLSEKILDASLCGVPQQRKRLFIAGELEGDDYSVLPYWEKRLSKKQMTVREYFKNQIDIEFYYRHPRSYKRRGIFSIDEPSPTIRGVNRPIPKGYIGHPKDPVKISENIRSLTTQERSQIQTFPKNFEFVGNKTDIEQLIGNAVPVKLAEYVAMAIHEYIQSTGSNVHKPSEDMRFQQSVFFE